MKQNKETNKFLKNVGMKNQFFSDFRANAKFNDIMIHENIEDFKYDFLNECSKKFKSEKEIDSYIESQELMLNELDSNDLLKIVDTIKGGAIAGLVATFITFVVNWLIKQGELANETYESMGIDFRVFFLLLLAIWAVIIIAKYKKDNFMHERIKSLITIMKNNKELIIQNSKANKQNSEPKLDKESGSKKIYELYPHEKGKEGK